MSRRELICKSIAVLIYGSGLLVAELRKSDRVFPSLPKRAAACATDSQIEQVIMRPLDTFTELSTLNAWLSRGNKRLALASIGKMLVDRTLESASHGNSLCYESVKLPLEDVPRFRESRD